MKKNLFLHEKKSQHINLLHLKNHAVLSYTFAKRTLLQDISLLSGNNYVCLQCSYIKQIALNSIPFLVHICIAFVSN